MPGSIGVGAHGWKAWVYQPWGHNLRADCDKSARPWSSWAPTFTKSRSCYLIVNRFKCEKNVFLVGWACERGRKLNEVLSHWMKSGHKLQFRVYISIHAHYTWNNNKSANLLRIITDKDQAKDLRCLVLQEILVIWLGTTLKSYNKGQWKIAVKILQLPLQYSVGIRIQRTKVLVRLSWLCKRMHLCPLLGIFAQL